MFIRKELRSLFYFTIAYIAFFTFYYLNKMNMEFLLYIIVLISFLVLIAVSDKRLRYPLIVLWGLSLWGLLHMAGGSIYIGESRLYDTLLIPISQEYRIFQYDQFVHILGFGVATLAVFYVLLPNLKKTGISKGGLFFVIVMAGLGIGALNEVIEFGIDLVVPQSGVGDYINTSLDLVSDLIGSILAWFYIRRRL